jgi:hypothetical protein
MDRTAFVFDREIARGVEALAARDISPSDPTFAAELTTEVRSRLAARATIGDLAADYTCSARHVSTWAEIVLVITPATDRTPMSVAVQCPVCTEGVDLDETPTDYTNVSMSVYPAQARWIVTTATSRLAAIAAAIPGAGGEELAALTAEQRLVESLKARAEEAGGGMAE